jgi:hypothetical protein
MYALVDCDNFYVSCERVFDPRLEGKPVVILSNNDGCSVSRSAEAKALGIGMAEPIFLRRDVVKRHGVICLSSNYTLYGDLSRRVASIYERFMFDAVDRGKSARLMGALDSVNRKFGRFTLNFARGHIHDDWRPKYRFRSPRYTTRWDELPIAWAR